MAIAQNIAPAVEISQPAPSDDRRSQIVAAANSLLGDEGLEGLTVRALLKRTGLARRAFYDGFPGKDDLVLAVFGQVLKGAADHFRVEFAKIDDPVECVRYFIYNIALGAYFGGDPARADRRSAALSREHLRLAEARPGELAQALRPMIDCLTEQVDRGMRMGRIVQGDAALQARLIYNILSTTTQTELLDEGHLLSRTRREKVAENIWQFCRRAISA